MGAEETAANVLEASVLETHVRVSVKDKARTHKTHTHKEHTRKAHTRAGAPIVFDLKKLKTASSDWDVYPHQHQLTEEEEWKEEMEEIVEETVTGGFVVS